MAESGAFGGYARMGEFVGENPSSLAQIVYFLKSRHTFGKMSLEIFDQNDKKIADLAPGKSKGINYVDWNYSLKPPRVAKGKTLVFGGFQGPTVLPGTYKVKVTKGAKTYESNLNLIANPKSIHTADDRKVQYETAMKLFNMTEELGYVVDQIDNYKTKIDSISPKLTSAKLKKQFPVADIASKMQSLKETLVVLKGDNYVGAAEPQLREKISGLYGEVLSYTGRPTNAQLASMKVLDEKLSAAKSQMDGFKASLGKLAAAMAKAKIPELKVRSFEEYKAAEN
jgi:hypothetical protein